MAAVLAAPSRAPWMQQQRMPQRTTCTRLRAADALGVVIVDHGSRRAASNDMLLQFCALYKRVTGAVIVEPAHMEIAEPTVAQAVGRCVAAGAARVVVAPYFLSRGRHIQDDIPALVAAAQAAHPGLACTIAEPIGIDPLMVQLIASRVAAAAEQQQQAGQQQAGQQQGSEQAALAGGGS